MAYNPDESMTEFSQLFNFDQATAPSHAQQGKTVVAPQFTAPGPENAFIPPQSQPTFQPPSHQYELFRQGTGFPSGAYYSQRPRQASSQGTGAGAGAGVPLFDISEADGNSFNGMDMDMPEMFDSGSMTSFVDPSSVGAGSEAGDLSPVAQPVQRLWPGMHQQHAAAKEQQKKLQEQQRLQLQDQQRKALAQQQLGAQQPAGHQRRPSQGRNKATDPLVEERISQILRSMRQNNARPDNGTPQPVMTQPAKQKKDEEDMDEDERLLASEEGKKLSSKERRQLRNKVSARAFRSRRKEYISQLEGELQIKTQEADELQFENDSLRTENAQLTDLARMLLSQPAFSNVLEDFAARGSTMPLIPQNNQHRGSIQQNQPTPTTAPQQPATTPMDFSTPMDGWNSGITGPDFNFNPTVFAVTELPEPVIDTDLLSGKTSEPISLPELPLDSTKKDYPVIERPTPKAQCPSVESSTEFDSEDLYAAASSPTTTAPVSQDTVRQLAANVLSGKSSSEIELVSVEQARSEAQALEARFAVLCERLDSACERIRSMTSRS